MDLPISEIKSPKPEYVDESDINPKEIPEMNTIDIPIKFSLDDFFESCDNLTDEKLNQYAEILLEGRGVMKKGDGCLHYSQDQKDMIFEECMPKRIPLADMMNLIQLYLIQNMLKKMRDPNERRNDY